MEKPKISACLVIYNEEIVLKRCLESLRNVVDEIIVVHDGSCSDRSLEIATAYGAKISIQDRVGEAEYHRPFAFSKASGDWILHIDADEFLPDGAAKIIRDIVAVGKDDAYEAWWPYWNGSKYFTSGPFSKEYKSFLFRKEQLYMLGIVHEYPRTYGKLGRLDKFHLYHEPKYNNFSGKAINRKWSTWAGIRASQIMALENIPVFNISDKDNNPVFKYYLKLRNNSLTFSFLEPLKFILIYLKKGLLLAGSDSWAVALRLVLFRFYQNYCLWRSQRTDV